MKIVIAKSEINGRWSYCLEAYRNMLRPELNESAPYKTVKDAYAAIKRAGIPGDAQIVVE